MSWMDSWSRPSKSQATPAPYYLIPGGENTPYCHTCGRLISQRRANAAASAKSEAKYCSTRCRSHKPGKLDREVEKVFVRFLNGELALDGHAAVGRKVKGEQRVLVPCSAVEDVVFGRKSEYGASDKSRTPEPETEHKEHATVEKPDQSHPVPDDGAEGVSGPDGSEHEPDEKKYVDGDVLARMSIRSGTRIRPPQDVSEVNGSVGGEKGWAERIGENEEMLEKRRQGQRRAKEKDMVRCAARRGVVFGFKIDEGDGVEERRLCEVVMNGKVVEPSFAKGDWCIRWRE